MIVGTGVDIVVVKRFESWLSFSEQRLGRLFHPLEIEELLGKTASDKATFLASRFAVKEAFFKAITAFVDRSDHKISLPPFLTLARSLYVTKTIHGVPQLACDALVWQNLIDRGFVLHLSISHEKEHAIAFLIIEQVK